MFLVIESGDGRIFIVNTRYIVCINATAHSEYQTEIHLSDESIIYSNDTVKMFVERILRLG